MTDAMTRPVIRLKPKANVRAIRRGAPWVFDNECVLDRRTKAIAPGTVATLQDADRQPLATVAVNPASRIVARVLDRDPGAEIGPDWLRVRIARALGLRSRIYDSPFYRLVHAEGDGMPGVVIDRFGDIAVIQPNAAWADGMAPALAQAVADVTGVTTVLKNAGSRGRALEGLDSADAVLIGTAPSEPVPVSMNGATYLADLVDGQKTGLYYDQRPNHGFVGRVAQGAQVLDVFSHVGGFALAALAGGAARAMSVDGSAPALALARGGADRMGAGDRFETRQGDGFAVMEALATDGARFDIVVCDPPAFAPNKPAVEAGLRAYERVARLAAPLVAEDGLLVLCSCSHAADLAAFTGACLRGIGRAGRWAQLIRTGGAGPDHPLLPQLAESGYLKSLAFRL